MRLPLLSSQLMWDSGHKKHVISTARDRRDTSVRARSDDIAAYNYSEQVRTMSEPLMPWELNSFQWTETPEPATVASADVKAFVVSNRTNRCATDILGAANLTLGDQVGLAEKQIIEDALQQHAGHRQLTAKRLGVSRITLYNKMKKYGLFDPESDISTSGGEE